MSGMSHMIDVGGCRGQWLRSLLSLAAAAWIPAAALASDSGEPETSGCRGVQHADLHFAVEAYDTAKAFPQIEEKLGKGLAVTIANEASWTGLPAALFGCKIYYDLWDETYIVSTLRGSLSAVGERQRIHDRQDALKLCYTTTFTNVRVGSQDFLLTTHLDPVGDEVLATTRNWLAEKGISGSSTAIFGRAAYAIIDLKHQEAISRRCAVVNER